MQGDFPDDPVPSLHRKELLRSGSMSNRPLPDKPLESGNPYYSVASTRHVHEEERCCDNNDMYTLYSTIDDLQQV